MKHYVNEAMWAKIEQALMEAEIPFSVSFDSHVNEVMDTITYDKYIRIDPFIIQKEVKANGR